MRKIAVVGGDLRYAYLAKILAEHADARGIFMEKAQIRGMVKGDAAWLRGADCMVLGTPTCFPLSESAPDMENFAKIPCISCGFAPCGRENVLMDLWNDEAMLTANARLTAEGAIFSAMGKLHSAIAGEKFMIIGYGRIGKALEEILRGMGAEALVASRRGIGVPTARVTEYLENCRGIFSTPPRMVLDANALERVPKDCFILDLASAPYGVDIEAARSLGLTAWREPGLPGRYCPESAAKVLAKEVLSCLKR